MTIEGVLPTAADRALADELGSGDPKLIVSWLVEGAKIRSTSWVGMARFAEFEVQVHPKLAGGSFGVMSMIGYASGIDALTLLQQPRDFAAHAEGFADLWCTVLAQEAERILLAGPVHDYVWQESTQPSLRGRLMMVEQVSRHFGGIELLECRFEDYLSDVLDNQLVLSGLAAGCTVAGSGELAHRMARLKTAFGEYCSALTIDVDNAEQQLQYNRRNEHYRAAHKLALLLLRNLHLLDMYETDGQPAVAFFLDMNPLFEQFATKLVQDAVAKESIQVVPQRRTSYLIVNEATGRTYSRVIPDMLLTATATHRNLAVDAKYKLYDDRSIDPADIYQVFMYAYAFQSQLAQIPTAMILYPTANRSSDGIRLLVQDIAANHSARLITYPVDVDSTLKRIRDGTVATSAELEDLRVALLEPLTNS